MKLGLAVDIADILTRAARAGHEFDPHAKAIFLQDRHPEAHVTRDEIVQVLVSEKAAMILERVPRRTVAL
jgi:hypothetical protein